MRCSQEVCSGRDSGGRRGFMKTSGPRGGRKEESPRGLRPPSSSHFLPHPPPPTRPPLSRSRTLVSRCGPGGSCAPTDNAFMPTSPGYLLVLSQGSSPTLTLFLTRPSSPLTPPALFLLFSPLYQSALTKLRKFIVPFRPVVRRRDGRTCISKMLFNIIKIMIV